MKTTRQGSRDGYRASNFPKRANCLAAIFSDTSVSCLMRIAENTSMPASMLDQLACHASSSVREAVADNRNTPVDTLWMLSRDECMDVRYAMAENHNLPFSILSALRDDENPYVSHRARMTIDRITEARLFEPTFWSHADDQRAAG